MRNILPLEQRNYECDSSFIEHRYCGFTIDKLAVQLLTLTVMTMRERISDHRLGAFIYGFLSGIGLIMIIWGLASITMLPSANLMMNVGFVLFGVTLLACGSCREAYLRGNLSVLPDTHVHMKNKRPTRPTTANLVSEQIIGTPQETEPQKTHEP